MLRSSGLTNRAASLKPNSAGGLDGQRQRSNDESPEPEQTAERPCITRRPKLVILLCGSVRTSSARPTSRKPAIIRDGYSPVANAGFAVTALNAESDICFGTTRRNLLREHTRFRNRHRLASNGERL